MTKLNPKLPEGEANGLAAIAADLVDEPRKIHMVLMLVDCPETKINNITDEKSPTARIRRIEVIDPDDRVTVEQMMRRALERRTGKAVLPIEIEDEIKALWDGIDPGTGEIIDDQE